MDAAKPYFTIISAIVGIDDSLRDWRYKTLVYGQDDNMKSGLIRLLLDDAKHIQSSHYSDQSFSKTPNVS